MTQEELLTKLKSQCIPIAIKYRSDGILQYAHFRSEAMRDYVIIISIREIDYKLIEKHKRIYKHPFRPCIVIWKHKEKDGIVEYKQRNSINSLVKLLKTHHLLI